MSIAWRSVRRPSQDVSARSVFRLLTAILASLGALVVIVTFTPLVSWWASALAGRWSDPCGDTLIVLSGAPTQGGVIGQSTYWRSAYAVLAYRKCGMRKIILTGGNINIGGTPVADSMAEFVESQGVPPERIVREIRSTSTRENALYTQPLLANSASPPVLLTSDFHMFRARRSFEKLGMVVEPRPIPDALKRASSWQGRWPAFLDVASETVKIVYYYARGWI